MEASKESFRACVKKLIADRGLSISKLTVMLGYPSETTLRRVNQNKAGIKSLHKVYADLIACEQLQLSDNEAEMFRAALLRQEKGDCYSSVYHEFWNLLQPSLREGQFPRFIGASESRVLNPVGIDTTQKTECLILNSCFDAAINYVQRIKSVYSELTIAHYVTFPTQPQMIVRIIGKLMPLLAISQYTAYSVSDSNVQVPEYNVIVVRSGNQETEIIFADESRCMETAQTGALDKWMRIAKEFPCRQFTNQLPLTDVAVFMEQCSKIEDGKDSMELRPDLCLRFISPDIARAAFMDRCKELGISIPKKEENRLLSVHSKRYEHIFGADKTVRLVVSKTGMLEFLNTGLSSDNTDYMRPYTVAERIQIFTVLHNHVVSNPHFFINLLLEEDEHLLSAERPIEFSCNGNDCLRITPLSGMSVFCRPDYGIKITDPNLIQIFRDFFLKDLIPNHTYPQKETVVFLKDCIRRLTEKL